MPETRPISELTAAKQAVEHARKVRAVHRRRSNRGAPQREQDISLALERIQRAMQPLRSMIGRFPYGPQTDEAEANRQLVRDASQELQRERRKLWKMQSHRS